MAEEFPLTVEIGATYRLSGVRETTTKEEKSRLGGGRGR
uniref:Uncharacterized protein n=1 Tax=Anguilla anguilla TaxID=7936 RepID=A0A0E9UFL8_ANGAN